MSQQPQQQQQMSLQGILNQVDLIRLPPELLLQLRAGLLQEQQAPPPSAFITNNNTNGALSTNNNNTASILAALSSVDAEGRLGSLLQASTSNHNANNIMAQLDRIARTDAALTAQLSALLQGGQAPVSAQAHALGSSLQGASLVPTESAVLQATFGGGSSIQPPNLQDAAVNTLLQAMAQGTASELLTGIPAATTTNITNHSSSSSRNGQAQGPPTKDGDSALKPAAMPSGQNGATGLGPSGGKRNASSLTADRPPLNHPTKKPRKAQGASASKNWEDKYKELVYYKIRHGDCCIPSHYPLNPDLAAWVQEQRAEQSSLSTEQRFKLDLAGFIWDPNDPKAVLAQRQLQDIVDALVTASGLLGGGASRQDTILPPKPSSQLHLSVVNQSFVPSLPLNDALGILDTIPPENQQKLLTLLQQLPGPQRLELVQSLKQHAGHKTPQQQTKAPSNQPIQSPQPPTIPRLSMLLSQPSVVESSGQQDRNATFQLVNQLLQNPLLLSQLGQSPEQPLAQQLGAAPQQRPPHEQAQMLLQQLQLQPPVSGPQLGQPQNPESERNALLLQVLGHHQEQHQDRLRWLKGLYAQLPPDQSLATISSNVAGSNIPRPTISQSQSTTQKASEEKSDDKKQQQDADIDEEWNHMFQQLAQYRKSHGHCRVNMAEHPLLGIWIVHQREAYRKGNLSDQCKAKLIAIDMDWGSPAKATAVTSVSPSLGATADPTATSASNKRNSTPTVSKP